MKKLMIALLLFISMSRLGAQTTSPDYSFKWIGEQEGLPPASVCVC